MSLSINDRAAWYSKSTTSSKTAFVFGLVAISSVGGAAHRSAGCIPLVYERSHQALSVNSSDNNLSLSVSKGVGLDLP